MSAWRLVSVGASLILAWGIAAASAAEVKVFNQTGTTAGTAGVAAPKTLTPGVRGPVTGGVVAPLTENECTNLGGRVETVAAAICIGTGKACITKDQKGTTHGVCISGAK